jgi:threonine/homoserine/homoserine lactone efflux protein
VLVALGSFTLAAGLLVLLPGPDTMVIVRSIVRGGRRRGLATVLGIQTGLLLWITAAVLGLAALLRASEVAYTVLRVVGAVYLVWLGVQSLRARGMRPDERPTGRSPLGGTGYWAGLLSNVLNPKVGVFFVTFLPQFIPHHAPVTAYTLLLGALYIAGTAAWFALLVRLAARLGQWLRRPATQRWMQRVTGVALLGFAVGMVTEAA